MISRTGQRARVMALLVRCVVVAMVAAAGAAGCRPDARGVVARRELPYVGKGGTGHVLVIRQADGSMVRLRVGASTWHRCRVHARYPECDHRRAR